MPLSTLYKRKGHGGWALTHVAAKCRALLIYRLRLQGDKHDTLTARWLEKWNLHCPSENPPHRNRIPAKLEYLRQLVTDSAYIPPQGPTASVKTYRTRIYTTLLTLLQAETPPPKMRIEKLWPHTNWQAIWKNLWATPASKSTKESWYRVIRDIVPTREHLHNIRIVPTADCSICSVPDTLKRRLTECGNGRSQWEWTRQ